MRAVQSNPIPQIPANLTTRCLRDRLPDPDWLPVNAALDVAVKATARAECEADRADRILGIVEDARREWQAFLDGLD